MSLLPLAGHRTAQTELRQAIRAGRLPQVLLITGPEGIGKQRLALWLAQLVLCVDADGTKPCGQCAGCIQVLGLAHPDLHWFVPVARPKGSDLDRQLEEVAESLEAVMADRRRDSLWTPPDGMAIHGIASARLLQRRASLTAAAGGWRVFIIGNAERLVPQESSPEAANALLKLLEEPPTRTLFLLTASAPGLLLPTIRSRATPLRLHRLTDQEVQSFLQAAKPELAADAMVRQAGGAIGAVLGDATTVNRSREAARDLLKHLADPRSTTERTLRQGPWQARGDFTDLLDGLAAELAAQARRATEKSPGVSPIGSLDGVACVLKARERAQGNVNPQLLLAVLVDELREALVS